jgi:hypothetical protein
MMGEKNRRLFEGDSEPHLDLLGEGDTMERGGDGETLLKANVDLPLLVVEGTNSISFTFHCIFLTVVLRMVQNCPRG